jgi:hypothetical protein
MMYGAHPAIEGLHALRDSLGVIVRARIPIGPDDSEAAYSKVPGAAVRRCNPDEETTL